MKALPVLAAVAILAGTSIGHGAEPVAIIEEADADAPVKSFTYLREGQVIELGAKVEMLIAYLESCVQERVRGGVVAIGRERSHVVGGHRSERVLDCRGATAELDRSEAERGAALVMRKPSLPAPDLMLASTSPFIAPKVPAASVRVRRLDRSEPLLTISLRGGVADLAALDKSLDRGGIYRVKAGAASVVVKIAANAREGNGPILLRLLSF